ncbi:hypothetical protein OXB_1274 [Bacillus sp. OxB-1]|uniref:hypothetical protein n=1 Tax=Bacillus sp. (strain OxB-1) TaxID=98228 RepID=UPI000581FAA0|nr:hypothetical protein [Bacillus sp. OxB-1]BAQ09746.1 hypothetical protein OXB_1274 [Bacillus sp. OxB-1]
MNVGQQKFQSFILERVQGDKVGEAEHLLEESFQKQADRTFDQAYLTSFMPRLKALLKPEHVEEVDRILQEYGSNFVR